MSCLICGRSTLPGAKLCADCRSARKRAFAATVTQPLLMAAGAGARLLKPSQSVAATARRAAERALFVRPASAEPPKAQSLQPSRADLMLLAVAVATILLAGALAAQRLDRAKLESTQIGDQSGTVERSLPRTGDASAQAAAQPTPLSDLTARAVAAMQTAEPPAAPAAPAVKPDTPKRAGARQRALPTEIVPAPETALGAQTLAVGPVAAPTVAREAPRADPVQVMTENLAQCANGDLIDRIMCDQRVRRQFCDGQWGKVPQCQSGVPSEHGQ